MLGTESLMSSMIMDEILTIKLKDIHKLRIPVTYHSDSIQRLKQIIYVARWQLEDRSAEDINLACHDILV